MTFIARLRKAYRWRTCPECFGKGVSVMETILKNNFHERPCSMCDGTGRVRYKFRVAWGVARRGMVDHEEDTATREDLSGLRA